MNDERWMWGLMLLDIDRKHGVLWCELVVYRGARLFVYDLALQKLANLSDGFVLSAGCQGELERWFTDGAGELVKLLPPALVIPYRLVEADFPGGPSQEWFTVNCWLDVLLSVAFPEHFPADKLEESFAKRAEIEQRLSSIPGVHR